MWVTGLRRAAATGEGASGPGSCVRPAAPRPPAPSLSTL